MLRKMMILSLLSILLIVGAFLLPARDLTYSEQGAKIINNLFQEMIAATEDFTDSSEAHDVKVLRKNIADLREQMDLYVYAYPFSAHRDLWMEIRRTLDVGLEQVNALRDLENSKDLEEIKIIKTALLNWKTHLLEKEDEFQTYLENPSLNVTYIRSKNLLSKFYWGVSLIDADVTISSNENFSNLIIDLATQAQEDVKTIKKIIHPTIDQSPRHKNTKTLHNFRMRIRSLAKIFRSQPTLKQVLNANFTPKLETLVTKYSELNDRIEEHERLLRQGRIKSAKNLEADLKAEWKDLIQYQKDMSILDFLQAISGDLS